MKEFDYQPVGVCSRFMHFEIEGDTVKKFDVEGGCNGNLKGIKSLIQGMKIDDVIEKLEGIDCRGKGTSCPDQIAKALLKAKEA